MPKRRAHTVRIVVDALRGGVLLVALWAAGEGLATALPAVPLTGSLWGALILFALLSAGVLPEAWVRRAAAGLLRVLGLLFVPVGVGIVAYGPLVRSNAAALIAAIVLGSAATLAAAAWAAAVAMRR